MEALKRAKIFSDTADSDFVRKSDKLTGVVVEAGVGKIAKPTQYLPRPTNGLSCASPYFKHGRERAAPLSSTPVW